VLGVVDAVLLAQQARQVDLLVAGDRADRLDLALGRRLRRPALRAAAGLTRGTARLRAGAVMPSLAIPGWGMLAGAAAGRTVGGSRHHSKGLEPGQLVVHGLVARDVGRADLLVKGFEVGFEQAGVQLQFDAAARSGARVFRQADLPRDADI